MHDCKLWRKSGLHDNKQERHKAGILLRNCMRVLKSREVINPFAHRIKLPIEAMMRRRLNEQFQDVIAQITRLHQYQRKEDDNQRLITTPEDIKAAIEIFFSAIMLKVDELDSSTRQYYTSLLEAFKGTTFTRRKEREKLRLKNTKSNQLLNHLVDMEYLHREGSANVGFVYSFTKHEDKSEKRKRKIKNELFEQVDSLLK